MEGIRPFPPTQPSEFPSNLCFQFWTPGTCQRCRSMRIDRFFQFWMDGFLVIWNNHFPQGWESSNWFTSIKYHPWNEANQWTPLKMDGWKMKILLDNYRSFRQGCRFVPYTFSEIWFPGSGFDSGPNLQPCHQCMAPSPETDSSPLQISRIQNENFIFQPPWSSGANQLAGS